ncbi:MAG: hypothetical protein R3B90_20100 [Planctomycetaceae bacterium]
MQHRPLEVGSVGPWRRACVSCFAGEAACPAGVRPAGQRLAVAVLLLLGCGLDARVSGDIVRLKNGGEVRGVLEPGHSKNPELVIETLTGGKVVLSREDVRFASIRSRDVEEYEKRGPSRTPSRHGGNWQSGADRIA